MLTILFGPTNALRFPWYLKISVGKDPKTPNYVFNVKIQLSTLTQWQRIEFSASMGQCQPSTLWSDPNFSTPWLEHNWIFFKIFQILRTISSGHYVIHTPAPIPVCDRKTVPNSYAPELLTRIVQSPTFDNDKM